MLSGSPIVATSCNMSGEGPIINGSEALEQFKDKVEIIIDGGETKHKIPSTIIKIQEKEVIVLRKGPINKKQIERKIKRC